MYSQIFFKILTPYLIIGIGFFLRRSSFTRKNEEHVLMRLLINIFLPCFYVDKLLGVSLESAWHSSILPSLLGFFGIAVCFYICRLAANLFHIDKENSASFIFTAGIWNCAFVPIPLIASLSETWNCANALPTLISHNVGVDLALWSIGVIIISGGLSKSSLLKMLNAPLLTAIAVLTINHSPVDTLATSLRALLLPLASPLGACAIPVGLLLSGMVLQEQAERFNLDKLRGNVLWAGFVSRFALAPIALLLLAKLCAATRDLRIVMAIQASMPAAIFPIVLVKKYGGKLDTAFQIIIFSNVLAIFLSPLWIALATKFLRIF